MLSVDCPLDEFEIYDSGGRGDCEEQVQVFSSRVEDLANSPFSDACSSSGSSCEEVEAAFIHVKEVLVDALSCKPSRVLPPLLLHVESVAIGRNVL